MTVTTTHKVMAKTAPTEATTAAMTVVSLDPLLSLASSALGGTVMVVGAGVGPVSDHDQQRK